MGPARLPLGNEATIQPKKVNFDQEIMEIGLICSNLIEKCHHSSNPGQNSFFPEV
jgi:hypothetical protein